MALLLCGSLAHAAPPSSSSRAEAKQHYETGLLKFDVAKYDEAVEEFQKAYELIGDAAILYNIAQSYRLGQKYDKALVFYKNYLRRRPDAQNRAEVERRIAEMTEVLEKQKKATEAPPTGTIRPTELPEKPSEPEKPAEPVKPVKPEAAPEPPPPAPTNRRALIGAGAGLGGLAVVSLVVGGTLLGLAGSASQEVEQAAANRMEFTPALRDTDASGRSFNTAGIALLAVGGASAVAAAVVLGIGLKPPRPSPSPGGARKGERPPAPAKVGWR
jgi:tetratricopeptide (TPR) repeat protein